MKIWIHLQQLINNCRDSGFGDGCKILNYDYSIISHMTYNEAWEYIQNQSVPEETSCLKSDKFYHEYYYDQGNSIVSEVGIS